MKKYLITGGAGFIGSHLSKRLLHQGSRVVVLDSAPLALPSAKVYQMDIGDAKKIDSVFKKERPDIVFHLAGAMHLRRSLQDPLFLKDLNFLSRIRIILEACNKYHVKKIVFVSSGGAIYENAQKTPTDERYPAHPSSLYGLANLMTEKYIEAHCAHNRIKFTIPRVSNAYGPRQWQTGFIPAIIKKILKGERPVIYGTGRQTRDFIYIDDLIEALLILADKGSNDFYNVGSGKEISLKKTFELTRNLLGTDMEPNYEAPRFFEVQRSALDIKKIKKELGWAPRVDMKTGILKTIDWFQQDEKN